MNYLSSEDMKGSNNESIFGYTENTFSYKNRFDDEIEATNALFP